MTIEDVASSMIEALFKPQDINIFKTIKTNLHMLDGKISAGCGGSRFITEQALSLAESKEETITIIRMAKSAHTIAFCLIELISLVKLIPTLADKLLKQFRKHPQFAMQIAGLEPVLGDHARSAYMQLIALIYMQNRDTPLKICRHLAQRVKVGEPNISAALIKQGEYNTINIYLCLLHDMLFTKHKISGLVYELLHYPVALGGSGFLLQNAFKKQTAMTYLNILKAFSTQHKHKPFEINNSLAKQNSPQPLGFTMIEKCQGEDALLQLQMLRQTGLSAEGLLDFFSAIHPQNNESLGMAIVKTQYFPLFVFYTTTLIDLLKSKVITTQNLLSHLRHFNQDNMNLLQCIHAHMTGDTKDRYLRWYIETEQNIFKTHYATFSATELFGAPKRNSKTRLPVQYPQTKEINSAELSAPSLEAKESTSCKF